jgi:hypothetical protein
LRKKWSGTKEVRRFKKSSLVDLYGEVGVSPRERSRYFRLDYVFLLDFPFYRPCPFREPPKCVPLWATRCTSGQTRLTCTPKNSTIANPQRNAAKRILHQAMSAIGRASTGTANKQKAANEFPTPKTRNPPRDFSDKYAAMPLTAVNATKRKYFFLILFAPIVSSN